MEDAERQRERQRLRNLAVKLAVKQGSASQVQHLLQQNANANAGVVLAGALGKLECLRLLLEQKANVDHENKYGQTALVCASDDARLDTMRVLVEQKADVNHRCRDSSTSLTRATQAGDLKCIQLLLQANADVNLGKDMYGGTALIFAAEQGDFTAVHLLLLHGADVNHQNENGQTALSVNTCGALCAFLLVACGATGMEDQKEEARAVVKTRITQYHTELKHVLEKKVIVDTRLYLEQHGLYHEPLERVMEYCGFSLMLERDPSVDEDDPIPQLLRERPLRMQSAWYWWNQLQR